MLNDSLKTLAATPPPAHRMWKFKTARSAHSEINRLESLLGMSPSALDCNMSASNRRIVELEAMMVSRNAAPVVSVAVPVVAAPVVETFGREKFCAAAKLEKGAAKSVVRGVFGRDRFCAAVKKTN